MITIYGAFRLLQICGDITCTWPCDSGAGKLAIIFHEIKWSLTTLDVIALQLSLICGIYKYWNIVARKMMALSQLFALMEVLSNLIICKLKRAHIQFLLEDLKDFLRTSNNHERIILQKYFNRYSYFAATVVLCYGSAIITFSCGPLFLGTKLPAAGWYPFSTESSAVIFVLYAMQAYSILQTGLNIAVDFMFAMLFMYSAARLEILCLEIQNAKSERQIKWCVMRHQEIIEFVNKTRRTVRYVLFKTNAMMVLTVICGAFPIIRGSSFGVMSQFIVMVLAGCQKLYITAWPADDLKQNSERVAIEAYNILWVEGSRFNIKDICFIIQRSQTPLIISMGSLLPNLSLEYYAKHIVMMVSYFTTMKAVLGDDND